VRTWGRDNSGLWQEVVTDSAGNNDGVYVTTLIQCLKLNLGESPFWANYGIPAQQSVMTQIFPDYYVYQTQQQFAQYFLALTIQKLMYPTPTYDISVVTHSGAIIPAQVPV
jgi:hypothetical protein